MSYSYLWRSILSFSKHCYDSERAWTDPSLSLQTETTETKRLSLRCKVPLTARGEDLWKLHSSCVVHAYLKFPTLQTAAPPTIPAPQLALTLDLIVSCSRYFGCPSVCVFFLFCEGWFVRTACHMSLGSTQMTAALLLLSTSLSVAVALCSVSFP